MSGRNTIVRSLHDLGIAAWFGGSLMGAIGLNGAAAAAKSPRERLSLASEGWARWAPVQLAAIAAHGVGGAALIASNKTRLIGQPESRTNTVVKLVFTGLAGAATLYSAMVGKVMNDHSDEGTAGVTEPQPGASSTLESAQLQQKILQWAIPALTLVVIVLGAQQGEQQRPIKGLLASALRRNR